MKKMKWKRIFKHCMFKRKYGKDIIGMQVFGFFYYVNDGKEVNLGNPQIMRRLFYHGSLVHALNPNTKERKGLIAYYRTYGITTLKKHVYHDDLVIITKIEVNFLVKGTFERKPAKKGLMF